MGTVTARIAAIRSTPFRATDRLDDVSLTNSFPSASVTVILKPFVKDVGGRTIQNWTALSFVAPSSTGVSQRSVTDVPAFGSMDTSGVVPTAGLTFAFPERRSPLLPSRRMDETDTPSP